MLSLAVTGLSLATTLSQTAQLKRDAASLKTALSGLAVLAGKRRSFSNEIDGLASDGKLSLGLISSSKRSRIILTHSVLNDLL